MYEKKKKKIGLLPEMISGYSKQHRGGGKKKPEKRVWRKLPGYNERKTERRRTYRSETKSAKWSVVDVMKIRLILFLGAFVEVRLNFIQLGEEKSLINFY